MKTTIFIHRPGHSDKWRVDKKTNVREVLFEDSDLGLCLDFKEGYKS